MALCLRRSVADLPGLIGLASRHASFQFHTSTVAPQIPEVPKETVDFGYQSVPRTEKETLVGGVFRSVAPSYDVMNDLMSAGMHRVWKDRLVEKLRPFPGMRHLDVAGGTGDVAFRVLRALREAEAAARPQVPGPGPSRSAPPQKGTVVIADINPAMLLEGRKRAAGEGIDSYDLEWVEASAETLPFPDDSMDSYTISFGIRNVTDRDAALREAKRVLRPGGRFLCLEFSKVVVPGLQQLYDLYSFAVIPQIGRLVANDGASYQYLVESIRMFPDQESWARQLEAAGLVGVEYENLMGGAVAIHSGFKLH
ncbi:COQ5A [Auxenochlorella protothecoides x Auxenochlorella symbiontica]